MDISRFPPPLTPPPPPHTHKQLFFVVTPLCSTCSPPPLPARIAMYLDVSHTFHPPASAACLCNPRRVPASAAVSCICLPTLCRPRPAPRYLFPPWWFTRHEDLCFHSVSTSPSVCVSSSPGIFWYFVPLSGGFFVKGQDTREPPLPGSRSTWYPPPPPPIFVLINSMVKVEFSLPVLSVTKIVS